MAIWAFFPNVAPIFTALNPESKENEKTTGLRHLVTKIAMKFQLSKKKHSWEFLQIPHFNYILLRITKNDIVFLRFPMDSMHLNCKNLQIPEVNWFNPHINWEIFHPLYNLNNQEPFFSLLMFSDVSTSSRKPPVSWLSSVVASKLFVGRDPIRRMTSVPQVVCFWWLNLDGNLGGQPGNHPWMLYIYTYICLTFISTFGWFFYIYTYMNGRFLWFSCR